MALGTPLSGRPIVAPVLVTGLVVFMSTGSACGVAGRNPRPQTLVLSSEASAQHVNVRSFRITWAGAELAPPTIERSKDSARARAETLAGMLAEPGAQFGEIAQEHADATQGFDAEHGIMVEPTTAAIHENVKSRAFRMNVGDVAGPIETPQGFVFLQRVADAPDRLETIRARHILVQYAGALRALTSVTRTREEALARAQEVLAQVRAGGDWIELHRANTDEPDSPEGGDLNRFSRGEMTPAFERVAFRLEVGATSDLVETPFGFHIIQRTE